MFKSSCSLKHQSYARIISFRNTFLVPYANLELGGSVRKKKKSVGVDIRPILAGYKLRI